MSMWEGLKNNPARIQAILMGLGMLGSKTQPQHQRYMTMGMDAMNRAFEHDRKEAARDQFKGLLGTKGEVTRGPDSDLGPAGVKPSGYLGGEMDAGEFAARAMNIPGYEQLGGGLLGQFMGNQADLQEVYAKAKAEADATNASKMGPFKDYKDWHTAQMNLRKEVSKELEPSRNAINMFRNATDIVESRGGFNKMTGADDINLIKAYVKMITPKEAVMRDDVENIVRAGGLPGTVQSYLKAFEGTGTLGDQQRQEIYRSMNDLYKGNLSEYENLKSRYDPVISQNQFMPETIFAPMDLPTPYTMPPQPPALLQRQPEQLQSGAGVPAAPAPQLSPEEEARILQDLNSGKIKTGEPLKGPDGKPLRATWSEKLGRWLLPWEK